MTEPSYYYHWIGTPPFVCQLRLVQHFKEKFSNVVHQLRENSYVGEYVLLQAKDVEFQCEINTYDCAFDRLPHFKEIQDVNEEIIIVSGQTSTLIMDADPKFQKLTEIELPLVDVPEGTLDYQRIYKSQSRYRNELMCAQAKYQDPISLCDCLDCLENRFISCWSADCNLETAQKAFVEICQEIPELTFEQSALDCGKLLHYLGKGDYSFAYVDKANAHSEILVDDRADLWEHKTDTFGYTHGQIVLRLPDIYDLEDSNLAVFKNLSRLLEKQQLFKFSRL